MVIISRGHRFHVALPTEIWHSRLRSGAHVRANVRIDARRYARIDGRKNVRIDSKWNARKNVKIDAQ